MFVERDDSGSDGGLPFGNGRPEQVDPAAWRAWSRGNSPMSATTDVHRHIHNRGELADAIQQLAVELKAIEREQRECRLDNLELIDRCLTVWFEIKELGQRIEAEEARE